MISIQFLVLNQMVVAEFGWRVTIVAYNPQTDQRFSKKIWEYRIIHSSLKQQSIKIL